MYYYYQKNNNFASLFILHALCLLASLEYPSSLRAKRISHQIVRQVKQLMRKDGRIWQVYFSPHDNMRGALQELIQRETQRIIVASYVISDKAITDALIEAHRRRVKVEVIACRSGAKDSWSKVDMLIEAGIPVYIYPAGFTRSIMHHKFAVFYSSFNRMVLITGSANWTRSGFDINCENILVQDDADLARQFITEFEDIKKLSVLVRTVRGHRQLHTEPVAEAPALS